MAAALFADLSILTALMEAGADVNATNQAGVTSLMRAATFEGKVRKLVAAGADVNARSRMGNTPLILGARKVGNSSTVKFLLDSGADVNSANIFGATALMAAATARDLDSVRILLDHGADVNAKPNLDQSANGFLWGGGRSALMWAAFLGDEPLLKLLLERGAKVNDFTLGGAALEQASWSGQVGAARVLLDAGAAVDQRDFIANYTPLHWAASAERSSPELVKLLLSRGADANAEGGQPVDNFLGETQTPLKLARKRGETPLVQSLIKAGARMPAILNKEERARPKAGASDITETIQRALPSLTKTAEESIATYLRHVTRQDCISCHQQQLPVAALSLAHTRHFKTNREATRHQIELIKRSFEIGHISQNGENHNILEASLQTTFHPEPVIMNGYNALALSLEQEPASAQTDAMVHQLATIQFAEGHWTWNLPRPPIQASDITATAQAILTLQSYAIPARREELKERVERARGWLKKVEAETNEERVHQVLGLYWSGIPSGELKEHSEALIRQQRADGGWG